jgi:hypothetical protein
MAHYRKEIRKVLEEMGFKNEFSVHEEKAGVHHEKLVMIKDWEPNQRAYELRKTIERRIQENISVCFTGPHITGKYCLK